MTRAAADDDAFLGATVQTYRQGAHALGLVVLRVVVLAGAVLGAWLIAVGSNGSPSQSPLLLCAIPVILVLLVAALPKLGRALGQWGDRAAAHARGLAYRRRGVWTRWQWFEIAQVTFSKESPGWLVSDELSLALMPITTFLVGHTYRYQIAHQDGALLTIAETLDGVEDLVATIREQTYATRLAGGQQAFDAGETVDFGAVTMHRDDGLAGAGHRCGWDEVSSIWIPQKATYLSIMPQHTTVTGAITVRTRDLWNVDVLFALAARRLGLRLEPGERFLEVEE